MKLKLVCVGILHLLSELTFAQELIFTDVSLAAGLDYTHHYNTTIPPMSYMVTSGSATGDIDNDGYMDLLFILGDEQGLVMMHNLGNGSFEDITDSCGMSEPFSQLPSGPLFFDYNQDEYIDLIIGSHSEQPPIIYINNGDLTFTKSIRPEFEILENYNTFSITAFDYNKDGLQDLFMSHWSEPFKNNHIWRNNGDGSFKNVDAEVGFVNAFANQPEYFFAVNCTDINEDGFTDILISSDYATSQIWINYQGWGFLLDQNTALSDENGMGGSIGDFDNDGDMDWFVTSIFDADTLNATNGWKRSGNKLYVNQGDGSFIEKAKALGVNEAAWAWGTSFADLNNDGYLDIVATNGWPMGSEEFNYDKTKIFLSNEGIDFTEVSTDVGLIDSLQGRGVSCLDYDHDGDLDIFITNMNGPVSLWQNELNNENHYITTILYEDELNPFGIGTRVKVYTGGMVQLKEVRMGSNYQSQDPYHLHFGLGLTDIIDSMKVIWSDGTINTHHDITADQILHLEKLKIDTHIEKISTPILTTITPNPSVDHLTYSCSINPAKRNIYSTISDSFGRTIEENHHFTQNNDFVTFEYKNLQKLSSGIYFVNIIERNKVLHSQSFVKK